MKITLEQIDLLRKRGNISYKEAKEALEKFDGDMVEALAYLEEEDKLKPEKKCLKESTLFTKLKSLISKGNKIKFILSKNNKIILNVPLTIALFITLISMPFVIAGLILATLTNCKIKFEKDNGEECTINSKLEKVSNSINSAANKITEEIKKA